MIERYIEKVRRKENLSAAEMVLVMKAIMMVQASEQEMAAILVAFNEKKLSVEEMTAAAKTLRQFAISVRTKHTLLLDTCGTGGDTKGTFNISTAVAFVVAGAGVAVAKHGNRSVSSKCGSADILEQLGVKIDLESDRLGKCLDKVGIAFLFAQTLHPAMKNIAPVRKKLGIKTIFNILGPLANPANATNQLIGVYSLELVKPLAEVLKELGLRKGLVVHGTDGLDEVTTTAKTSIAEYNGKEVVSYEINPLDLGIPLAKPADLKGGDAVTNAAILTDVFGGKRGPKRDIVVLNAACALYAAEKVIDIKAGVQLANEVIDAGKAKAKLEELKRFTNKI